MGDQVYSILIQLNSYYNSNSNCAYRTRSVQNIGLVNQMNRADELLIKKGTVC